MPVDLIGAQSEGVLHRIKKYFVIVRPGDISLCIAYRAIDDFTRAEIFQVEGVPSTANGVYPIGQQVVIFAYIQTSNLKKGISFGEIVYVQYDFLASIHCSLLAAIDGIFLAFLVTVIIPVTIIIIRYGFIILFDTSHHLGI